MAKGFQKGIASNPKGKKPGTQNRTTKEAKELLEQILLGQLDNIEAAFNLLQKDPGKYLDACSKLFTYVLPKKTDVTSDGDKLIPTSITFIESGGDPGK